MSLNSLPAGSGSNARSEGVAWERFTLPHLGLERPVAVKIIKQEFAADPDVVDRFLREARTMAKLRHPHAAMIFDAGSLPDGRHFIIMEFVEGETLSKRWPAKADSPSARRCKSPLKSAMYSMKRIASASFTGSKPSNIILSERGVCVLDFGVAKVLASAAESTTTREHRFRPTSRDAALHVSRAVSGSTGWRSQDLYSLGVVLYEMLAGRPPFIDPLQSALLVKQATAAAHTFAETPPDVPRPLALAVHTLFAKRPEDRPRTAAAAKALLERSLTHPSEHCLM